MNGGSWLILAIIDDPCTRGNPNIQKPQRLMPCQLRKAGGKLVEEARFSRTGSGQPAGLITAQCDSEGGGV